MEKKAIATITKTNEILSKYNFQFKKNFGQNFLVDLNILNNIVTHANIDEKVNVIEIGPGIGSLTEQLAKKAKKVVAYEIDKRLIPILNDTLKDYDNIKIINEDILKANIIDMISSEFEPNSKIVVVANLPYYITTPILMKLLKERIPVVSYCVMIQKEVAQRLSGGPSTKEYNALTIITQYYTEPKIVMNVPSTVFIPKPNVDSAILKLDVRKVPPVKVKDEEFFFFVVKGSFIQRRKTIFNNLKQSMDIDREDILKALEEAKINPSIRGEALTIEEFAKLSDELLIYKKGD